MENNKKENKTEMLSKSLFDSLDKNNEVPDPRPKTISRKEIMNDIPTHKGDHRSDQIDHFQKLIRGGSKQQMHDASKAIGYIALIDGFNAKQKKELKEFILVILQEEKPRISVAFALLEALQRIDVDAFWQFVVTNYAELYQQ